MGDTIDIFKAMKELRRETRLEELHSAQSEWTEFVEAAGAGGYTLRISNDRHWLVYRNVNVVAQYWPSANKWQITKTGKIKHGDREEFRRNLREKRL